MALFTVRRAVTVSVSCATAMGIGDLSLCTAVYSISVRIGCKGGGAAPIRRHGYIAGQIAPAARTVPSPGGEGMARAWMGRKGQGGDVCIVVLAVAGIGRAALARDISHVTGDAVCGVAACRDGNSQPG